MIKTMTGIETLIHKNNIQHKLIASDLDGTLLWGDLGETVFFLLLAMQCAGVPAEEAAGFLSRLKQANAIGCGPNPDVSDAIHRYQEHLRTGELVMAYSLIDHYLGMASPVNIRSMTSLILNRGIPRQKLVLLVGEDMYTLTVHVELDALMTRLLKDSYARGAEIRIISGSPQAVVEGFCQFLGLPKNCARGVAKRPDGGVVVPFGRKKLEILAEEGFERPYIAVGNSPGDFEMLRAAEHAFVRKSSPREALEEAGRRRWELV